MTNAVTNKNCNNGLCRVALPRLTDERSIRSSNSKVSDVELNATEGSSLTLK